MLTLKDITNKKALDYIYEQLSKGNLLSRLLSESLDLSAGITKGILPSGIREIENFYNGGILPQGLNSKTFKTEDGRSWIATERPSTTVELAQLIKDYLALDAENLCIFEDAVSKPEDQWLSHSATELIIVHNEVYHWLSSRADIEKISNTIRRAQSWRLIGCLTSFLTKDLSSLTQNELDIEAFDIFVKNVEQLIISAFDGESYLIWYKNE